MRYFGKPLHSLNHPNTTCIPNLKNKKAGYTFKYSMHLSLKFLIKNSSLMQEIVELLVLTAFIANAILCMSEENRFGYRNII